MTGLIAQGKRAEAAALWNRYGDEVRNNTDLGLRLLYAHAFVK